MRTPLLIALACLSYSLKAQNTDTPQDTTQAQTALTLQKPVTMRLDGPTRKTGSRLIILDGKEISEKEMEIIDPDHITSVRILKDAKSLAAYGEKGRHGVIIIERKKNRFKLE